MRVTAGLALFLAAHAAKAQVATFELLPPVGVSFSAGYSVSGDGRVIVGIALHEQPGYGYVAWIDGQVQSLLPGRAFSVSRDGRFFSGQQVHLNVAARWTDGVLAELPPPPGPTPVSFTGHHISADGSAVVGAVNYSASSAHFRWTAATGTQLLETPPSMLIWSPAGVAEDGSIIVGSGGNPRRAVWWENGVVSLLPNPAGHDGATAIAMNPSASVVVGRAGPSSATEFVRWTGSTPTVAAQEFIPVAVAEDGWRVAGTGGDGGGALWDPIEGIRDLREVLIAGGAQVPPELTRLSVFAMSLDGRTLVGTAGQSGSDGTAFKATIPAFCYANCDGSTQAPVLTVNDFSCFLGKYSSGERIYTDCDQSGAVNVLDFLCFINAFNRGCESQ